MQENINSKYEESILIIDDQEDIRLMWQKILKKNNYNNTNLACDGKEGFDKFQQSLLNSKPYDLLLVDLKMPRMNGEEFIRNVREHDENIVIIIITGHGEVADAYELLDKYQISDFLYKPLKHPGELLFSVRNALEKSQLKKSLKKHNIILESKVYERNVELIKKNKELLIAKEAAQKANEAKNTFLRCLSHELNTPLNAIIGFTDILINIVDNEQKDEIISNLETIMNNARHLHTLISEILDFVNIDHFDVDLFVNSCNLQKLFTKCMNLVKDLALRKKINIVLNIVNNTDNDIAVLDENKIKKIMINLLTNAIIFSNEEDDISINVFKNNDNIEVKVCDNGTGIEEKNNQNVFIPFFQVNSGLTNKSPGVGLGLTIAKRLVENHYGKIWVESDGLYKGTNICFMIPQHN